VAGKEVAMAEAIVIKKTLVWIAGKNVEIVDTIEYDNKLWLVPLWLVEPSSQLRKPVRLVRLDCLEYEQNGSQPAVDFRLNEILPKYLFDQTISDRQESRFEVVESPGIWFEHQSEE
jgi:hypothetical protein